jgi:hypothetical protein
MAAGRADLRGEGGIGLSSLNRAFRRDSAPRRWYSTNRPSPLATTLAGARRRLGTTRNHLSVAVAPDRGLPNLRHAQPGQGALDAGGRAVSTRQISEDTPPEEAPPGTRGADDRLPGEATTMGSEALCPAAALAA